MKKDTYLVDMISVPPKQKVEIKTFDERTQNDAFWVSLEGLKGVSSGKYLCYLNNELFQYNIHTLIPETDQAREDRKRRKEARKAEKAEKARQVVLSTGAIDSAAAPEQGILPVQVPTPMTNGAPTPAANASLMAVVANGGVSNGLDVKRDRMTNHPPSRPNQQNQPRTNSKVSTPNSQRPSTPLNRQTSAQVPQRPRTPQQRQQPQQQQPSQPPQRPQPTPLPTHTQSQPQSRMNLTPHTQSSQPEVNPRGVKRERPDTPLAQQMHSSSHPHSSQVYPNHGMMSHPATAKKRRLESATAVR